MMNIFRLLGKWFETLEKEAKKMRIMWIKFEKKHGKLRKKSELKKIVLRRIIEINYVCE